MAAHSPFFTQNYSVILYDLVCAGSVNPDYFDFRRYTTLDAYVDDLLNILDALRVDRCAYVGHSVSAMIGLLASIRRPELFSKLILIGASPRFLNDKDYHGGFERPDIENVFAAMEANYEAWVNGFAPLAVGPYLNSDLRGILGLVKVPCCIIQTAKDVSVPASVAEYLKTHLGGRSTVEILRTEGHLPHLSAPALLAQVIRRALSR
ncbi:hypothetical protein GH714_004449 [Hevea brasiliensis]|uniref:AB hydrolase-1 domain-containing protein n=1 Tax=Hevea brasiliensis TaxID=3981 RepID=A0A6A6MAX3_HEVBR|nr:hypothetical protein GH714_004449 [Hevea brasiliensis]